MAQDNTGATIRQTHHYERFPIEHDSLLFNWHEWRRLLLLLITHNIPLARGCHDGSPFGSVTWTWSLVTILVTRLLVRFQFDGATTGRKLRSTAVILTGYHHLHFIHLHEILTRVGFTKNLVSLT